MTKKSAKITGLDLQLLVLYQEQVLEPKFWINQADELIQASDKFVPSIKKYWLSANKNFDTQNGTYKPPPDFKTKKLFQSTYFMLIAYALENYFKAILVSKFQTEYKNEILRTGKLPLELNKHDLLKLAAKTNFTLSIPDTSLLIRLYRNSLWQARYPVPASADRLNGICIDNGNAFFSAFLVPDDILNIKTLVRRVKKFLYASTQNKSN